MENLETTKRTASEIEEKVKEANITEKKINEARENYRPAAARASLLYFILNDLIKINPLYQFSLKAFSVVFHNAIDKSEKSEDLKVRVANLIDSITYMVFVYTSRGLFERDKLIFTSQVTFLVCMECMCVYVCVCVGEWVGGWWVGGGWVFPHSCWLSSYGKRVLCISH